MQSLCLGFFVEPAYICKLWSQCSLIFKEFVVLFWSSGYLVPLGPLAPLLILPKEWESFLHQAPRFLLVGDGVSGSFIKEASLARLLQ